MNNSEDLTAGESQATTPVPPDPPGTEKSKRPWWKKKRFIIPIGVFLFFVIVGSLGDSDKDSDKAKNASSEAATTAKPKDAKSEKTTTTKAPATTEAPTTTIPLTPEQRLRTAVEKGLDDKKQVRDVKVQPAEANQAGRVALTVEFNGKDNLTSGLTKRGIELDMRDISEQVYAKSGVDVEYVEFNAFLELVDKYGNKSTDSVYRAILRRDTADKINWKEKNTLDFGKIIDPTFVHPAIN